ncbi:Protein of unknown function [Pyronema omphalodes CBS 100304]|uniref:Uncharacterized protein n=1 Tax=Pyronema omphalodes (strain CBS 100304) TaxID=1076935 RepID=U4LQY9_PYROM|nr:Protein of unknown function [Pyronema omphalodes CBS 100304]
MTPACDVASAIFLASFIGLLHKPYRSQMKPIQANILRMQEHRFGFAVRIPLSKTWRLTESSLRE